MKISGKLENFAVYERYLNRYMDRGGKAKLARELGLSDQDILHIISSAEIKKKLEIEEIQISTMSGYLLSTLPERDQSRVVAQLQNKIISKDLQKYIPKLKGLSEEIQNAIHLRKSNIIRAKRVKMLLLLLK